MHSHDAGGCDFPCDPETLADRQSQFWIPSLQPQAVMLSPAPAPEPASAETPGFTLAHLDGLDLRRADDGWHGLWRVDGVAHQFWLPEAVPDAAAFYAVTLPMDSFLELRAHAARRLWRSLNGRAPGPDFRTMPSQLRQFHILSLRALDAKLHGETQAQILLTTFSKALANALKVKLQHLAGNEPAVLARITVQSITGVAYDLYSSLFGQPNIASPSLVHTLLTKAAGQDDGQKFSLPFLAGEWSEVVDAWQIESWEGYRDVSRLGRKTRIGGKQREALWSIFEQLRAGLAERKAVTWSGVFGSLAAHYGATEKRPFDFAVVDEAQDISVAEARFLAALVSHKPDGLFFAGDLGQRIFQQPFSWKSLGIHLRGRSHTLRINYRTSHQIRAQADRLLPPNISDVDGNTESRRGTISVFNGPAPEICTFDTAMEESEAVGHWLADRLKEGCQPHEVGLFVRTGEQLKRARTAIKTAGAWGVELSDKVEAEAGNVAISTMHLAKGLEFRAVAVMACDDEVLPLQERIETVADEADLEEVYNTERHLLYVACTRARDRLLITGVDPASEFLDDLAR